MQDYSTYLPGILLAYTAFLLAISSPGPNILAIIDTSINSGRRPGVTLALGLGIGDLTWAASTMFGLSAVLTNYAHALFFIKFFGGLYLLWLAYKSFKSASSPHSAVANNAVGKHQTSFGYFQRGYIIQMTNPKAALAWIAIISLGLQDGAPHWVGAVIVVGTFAMSIIIHTLYAVAFSNTLMVKLYGKCRQAIQVGLGMFFAFAGIRLLLGRN